MDEGGYELEVVILDVSGFLAKVLKVQSHPESTVLSSVIKSRGCGLNVLHATVQCDQCNGGLPVDLFGTYRTRVSNALEHRIPSI